mmetsp:Transcript_58591/g.121052  ORF Transcript_58591/g.121052 Transcript_58591/m.121052 type:complete len:164 (-) Transcript_58591:213-704(-)
MQAVARMDMRKTWVFLRRFILKPKRPHHVEKLDDIIPKEGVAEGHSPKTSDPSRDLRLSTSRSRSRSKRSKTKTREQEPPASRAPLRASRVLGSRSLLGSDDCGDEGGALECLAIVLDESSPDMQLPGAMKDEMPNKSTSEPADEDVAASVSFPFMEEDFTEF